MNNVIPLRWCVTLAAATIVGPAPVLGGQIETVQQASPDADALANEMRALAANPNDLNALIRAGELALDVGDQSAAARFFARADRIDPRNGRLKAGTARTLLLLERPGEALRLFDEAERLGYDASHYAAERGLAFDLVGEQQRAQRDYRLALKLNPDPETSRRYALSLGISGRKDQALAEIDALLRRSDRAAWRVRAFVLAMSGDVAGAERIATSMLPGDMASGLIPFFARLRALGPVDRAFAVHFGELAPTPARIADARLTPSYPPLPPEPIAPIRVAATDAKGTRADRRKQRGRDRERPVEVASVVPPPARVTTTATAPAQRPITPAARVLPAARPDVPRSAAPQTPTELAARSAIATSRTTDRAIVAQPSLAVGAAAASPAPTVALPMVAAQPVPVLRPSPAPVVTPTIVQPPAAAPIAVAAADRSSVTPATAPVEPTPTAVAMATPTPTPTLAAVALPRATVASPAATDGGDARASVAERASPAAASPPEPIALQPSVPATTVSATALPPVQGPLLGSASAATEAPPAARPVASEESILSRIVASIAVPAAELDVPPVVRTVDRPAPAVKVAAAIKPPVAAGAKLPPETPVLSDEEKRAAAKAEAKKLADKKAADKKAAEKLAADKRAAEEAAAAKKAAKAEPSRVWVQVAGGANVGDLPKEWTRLRGKAGALLQSRQAWTTPLRFTNRLLTGPFKSSEEAQGFVNQIAKSGVTGFVFTSDAGQKVTRLPAK